MSQLKDKKVVVAGGTSGIGLAVAKRAAQCGAKVWAFGRTHKYIEQAKREVGDEVSFLAADIHDVDALTSLFEEVGQVDHLVGSATGANRTIAPFMEQSHEQFAEAFNKFWGYTKLVRAGMPFMSQSGSITLISGVMARKCPPGMSAISCVGNAVEGFCRAIALEIAPVRINTVAPGTIDTSMYDWMGADKDEQLKRRTEQQPIKRPGTPEEVADAVIYLMSASYVTGSNIDVDGGQLLP